MANLGKTFNANDYEELGDFSPLPDGDYNVVIESTEIKPLNAAENGDKLVLTYVVTNGEYANRKLFDNLNLWHKKSLDAVIFAERKLAQICRVVGKEQISDTDELVGCNLSIRVETKENDGKDYNHIKAYNKFNGSTPETPTKRGSENDSKRPWEK